MNNILNIDDFIDYFKAPVQQIRDKRFRHVYNRDHFGACLQKFTEMICRAQRYNCSSNVSNNMEPVEDYLSDQISELIWTANQPGLDELGLV